MFVFLYRPVALFATHLTFFLLLFLLLIRTVLTCLFTCIKSCLSFIGIKVNGIIACTACNIHKSLCIILNYIITIIL